MEVLNRFKITKESRSRRETVETVGPVPITNSVNDWSIETYSEK